MVKKKGRNERKIFQHDLERSEWLHQLEGLLQDGFSLSETLNIIKVYETGKKKDWVEDIYNALLNGEDFSSQLKIAGYSNEIVSYIYFAEKYGDLKKALVNSVEILKKKFELLQKTRRLLNYPFFLFICLIVMATVLAEGVFPQFQTFFASMDQGLPWITRVVINIISIFNLPFLLVFFVICLFFLLWFRRKPIHTRISFLLKIPLIRSYITMLYTYHLVSQLSPMLNNGFSLYKSLNILKTDSQMQFLKEEAGIISEQLTEGEEFANIVKKRDYYEPQLSAMITLGEAKGMLGVELEQYGNYLLRKQYERMHKAIVITQPVLFGIIGFIVLVLFLSMMVPIFNIVNGW